MRAFQRPKLNHNNYYKSQASLQCMCLDINMYGMKKLFIKCKGTAERDNTRTLEATIDNLL